MKYTPALQPATLLKRYKRFLADLQLNDGTEFTAHCANTGKMTGCAEPGFSAFYSTSDNSKRKYPQSLELTQNSLSQLICVNTAVANKVVEEAINNQVITELNGYEQLQSEVKYGSENSRIDFLLTSDNKPTCYVEVKSVTLLSESAPQKWARLLSGCANRAWAKTHSRINRNDRTRPPRSITVRCFAPRY